MSERTDDLARAYQARDELIAQLRFGETPHATIVSIGIGREDGRYVVAVDILEATELPGEILGVPVRSKITGRPIAYGHV